jgi:hypothetical protein
MKTNTIKIIAILFTLTALCSCEYEIDYTDSIPKDKLVITSFIEQDSTIAFSVFKSAPIGSYEDSYDWGLKSYKTTKTSDYTIYDATAQLYVNGQYKESTNKSNANGKYSFAYIPQQGDNINIKVAHSDFDQVSGSAILSLSKPQVDSVSLYTAQKIDNDGQSYTSLILYISIQDNGNDNYYQLSPNIIFEGYRLTLDNATMDYENYQNVFTESSSGIMSGENNNKYGVFSNGNFKGKQYILRLSLLQIYSDYGLTKLNKAQHNINYSVAVSKIDKGAFNYLYSLNKYLNSSTINSEPVIIMNNLENGYGFIGAKNTSLIHKRATL